MLVLDTEELPAAEAWEVFYAGAVAGTGTCGMTPEPGLAGTARWRIEQWQFGPVAMITTTGPATRYWQTTRHLRQDSWNTIGGMTQIRGRGDFTWNDHQQALGVGDIALCNKSAGFWEYRRKADDNESLSILVDADQVGLPERTVHSAMPLVRQSPVTPLLLGQIRALHREADLVAAQETAEVVGESLLALVRAVIASVGAPGRERRDVADETRMARVLAYVRVHLRDPELTAARVAAAHNISLRSLYRLCDESGIRLEPWIIRRRLDGARKDLASPRLAHQTVETIARSWGFTHPSHFTRRFKAAFGTAPRAWRAAHRASRPADAAGEET